MITRWEIGKFTDDAVGFSGLADRAAELVRTIVSAYLEAPRQEILWEILRDAESIGRAVVQFPVSAAVFDEVFNSVSGYRAMYRAGPWIGSCTNSLIAKSIVELLSKAHPTVVPAWELRWGPEVTHQVEITAADFLRSIDPALSKLWYSTALVSHAGELRTLPSGISDRKIDVGLERAWVAVEQAPEDCFLELKGAFLGHAGLFQPKAPETRAIGLARYGSA